MKTLIKTLTWRTVGTADIMFWTWMATGKLTTAAGFAAAHFLYKAALYFCHELAWNKVGAAAPATVAATTDAE